METYTLYSAAGYGDPICTGTNWSACLAYAQAYRADYAKKHDFRKPEVNIIDDDTGELLLTLPEETPLECADFSVRAYNCLKRTGIDTIEDLKAMPIGDLWKIRNFGMKSICEVIQYLLAEGVKDETVTLTMTRGEGVNKHSFTASSRPH